MDARLINASPFAAVDLDAPNRAALARRAPGDLFAHPSAAPVNQLVADVMDDADRQRRQPVATSLVGRVLDAFLPGNARAAQARARDQILKDGLEARAEIHSTVVRGQVAVVNANVEVYVQGARINAAHDVARHAVDTVDRVQEHVLRTGARADLAVDAHVRAARQLESGQAQTSAADRLDRMGRLRGEAEEAVVQSVIAIVDRGRSGR